jgi:hypothetical protein
MEKNGPKKSMKKSKSNNYANSLEKVFIKANLNIPPFEALDSQGITSLQEVVISKRTSQAKTDLFLGFLTPVICFKEPR